MRRFPFHFVALSIFAMSCLPAMAQQEVISTLIGGGPNDIPALQSDLDTPIVVALDNAGNYYIGTCSSIQNRVFKVNTSGILTVVAGSGLPGFAGDGVPGGAANALLNCPAGIAVDSSGNVYISDYYNYVVRKVDTTNTITTIAGMGGTRGFSGDGGPATSAELNDPFGIALDTSGNLYIADSGNCRVRKVILSTDIISTYAGTGSCTYGGDGGAATSAQLNSPSGVATDAAGNLYIADTNNYRIRYVVKSTGIITTIAGSGTYGYSGDGGPAIIAEITQVYEGIAVNAAGTTVTIADYSNQRIRQFTVAGNPNTGTINTIAGSGTAGFCGDNGPAPSACLYYPEGVAVTTSGNVYVADRDNDRVRFFTVTGIPNTGTITTVAGNGSTEFPTLTSGVPPQGVVLYYPWDVLEDPSGNVYASDQYNCLVRELVQATDLVNFFAGTGTCGYSGDGGPATSAELNKTYGVARDSSGNIYIADIYNQRIRMVSPSGTITTFAGTGTAGFSGDGGPATSAELYYPYGVAVDGQNNVYIADTYNYRIRKVSGGTITTFAGNGTYGYLGDGDPATDAEFRYPYGVSTDAAGNVYIADTSNCRIREVSAATGIIDTVAGDGSCGFSGDGPAIQSEINSPEGVWSDANGNLFIADTYNERIRWVNLSGIMTTIAGTGTAAYTGDGGVATSADLYYPSGVALDASGNILVADQFNFRVRKISAFAALNTSAESLAFGVVPVGSTGTPQVLTVSAIGPLTISSIVTSGNFAEADDCGSGLATSRRKIPDVSSLFSQGPR
jgi:trimeric autotransporter adhesin